MTKMTTEQWRSKEELVIKSITAIAVVAGSTAMYGAFSGHLALEVCAVAFMGISTLGFGVWCWKALG